MELAKTERSYSLQRQNKTLHAMLKNLATYDKLLQPRPSQSIFRKPRRKNNNTGTTVNTAPSSSDVWKQRCQTQFHRLLRSQDVPHSSTGQRIEFTPIVQLFQTKSIKIKHTKAFTVEDVVALFWQIGDKCKACIQFDMSRASRVSFDAIRGLLLTPSFGAQLIILRAVQQPAINDQSLGLFASRCTRLKVIDFSKCQNVTDTGLRNLFHTIGAGFEAISLSECTHITGNALRNIGETCAHLELLDISKCPQIHDAGWLAFGGSGSGHGGSGSGHRRGGSRSSKRNPTNRQPNKTRRLSVAVVKRLEYLNLQSIGNTANSGDPSEQDSLQHQKRFQTTEKCLVHVFQRHTCVKVLNLSNNSTLVTDKSMRLIGTFMTSIVSLNVARNKKITDEGLRCVGQGCASIQAINIASLGRLTTPGIYQMLRLRSNSLKLVNMTGLQGIIPTHLIQSLSRHLPYAQPALSFYGFTPVDDVVYKKLVHQWNFIEKAAASLLQAGVRGSYDRAKVRLLKKVMSHRIQLCWHRYKAKKTLRERKLEQQLEIQAGQRLVAWMSIVLERIDYKRNEHKRNRLRLLLKAMHKNATTISALYRGHYNRTNARSPIADIMVWLEGRKNRMLRQQGVQALVCLQRRHRNYLFKMYSDSDRMEHAQRRRDCHYAVRVLQQAIRMFVAKMKLHYLWDAWNKKNWKLFNACVTIQCMVRKHQALQLLRAKRTLRREGIKRKHLAAATIQGALYRGTQGRQHGYETYCQRTNACVKIQSLVRRCQVGHWQTMSPDLLYSKWRNKSDYEIMSAIQSSTQKIKKMKMKFIDGNSASESDEEWEPVWDEVHDCQMYFSAKRNATRRDPSTLRVWEKSLVGEKVMVFDEWDTQRWIQATIKQYNSWKHKWKIIFAGKDGDYLWIDMKKRHELFMMRRGGEGEGQGDWLGLRLLFPGRRDPMDL